MEQISFDLQILFFYDLFKQSSRIELNNLNIVEAKFLLSALDTTKEYFHFVNKELFIEGNQIFLRNSETKTKYTEDEIRMIHLEFIQKCNKKEKYNYHDLSNHCLRLGKELVQQYFKNIPNEEFSKVNCMPLVFTGEEWSITYEVGFSAGGYEIAYPDASIFTDAHIKQITSKGFSTSNRIYIDYCIWCHVSILHEFIHSIQHIFSLTDKSGWILEHDASRLQGIVPALLTKQLGYLESFIYIIALHHLLLITIAENTESFDCNIRDKYVTWRDSFGKIPPVDAESFSYNGSHLGSTIYLKQRLGIEALMANEGNDFSDILAFMFSRTGDLMCETQPDAPITLRIPEHATLENLRRKIQNPEVEEIKKKLME